MPVTPFSSLRLIAIALGLLLCVVFVKKLIIKNSKVQYFIPILSGVFTLVMGYFWGEIHLYFRLKDALPASIEGKVIAVEGRIVSLPNELKEYQQFQFEIEKSNTQHWQGKVMLSWYTYRAFGRSMHHPYRSINTRHKLQPGEKWHFMVKLKRSRGYSNPGGFNYEAWLFDQKIEAKGYIIDNRYTDTQNYRMEKAEWHEWVNQIRQSMAKMWEPFQKEWSLLSVLLALTIGVFQGISSQQWQVFTNTGTIHLISISGLHISFLSGIALNCISFLWRRIPFLCERWPAQRAGAVGAFFVGLAYSFLAGFSVPTQRSLIMISVFIGGILFQKQTKAWQCFGLSLLLVILWDPLAPLGVSFWLSYSAVAVILYVAMDSPSMNHLSGLKKWLKSTWESAKLQTGIFLGLIPFSLFWFSQVSVSSLWANFIAIPVTELFVLPMALVAMMMGAIYFPWAVFFMHMSHIVFFQLFRYLDWISAYHPVIWVWSINKIGLLLLGVLGIALLIAPKGIPVRWLGGIFWIPLLFPLMRTADLKYGEAYFSLLDVGQGLASVIQTQHHVLIFDTGPKLSENFDTGKAVVLPYLKNQHIQKVDAIVISHADMDHRGGLESILAGIHVNKVFVNDKRILKTARLCDPKVSWRWDGVIFQFLTEGLKDFSTTNDTSCVLKIYNAHQSILLPGDLEKRGEKRLIKQYGAKLKTDLLVAGHHGSKTSSSVEWVKITQPYYVLWATGYLNRYHFPNPDVVRRYTHAKALSTVECGMIYWKLSNTEKRDKLGCYRRDG